MSEPFPLRILRALLMLGTIMIFYYLFSLDVFVLLTLMFLFIMTIILSEGVNHE